MEILLNSSKEVIQNFLIGNTGIFGQIVVFLVHVSCFVLYVGVIILLGEQIWDFSYSQNIVDIFNESLIYDLVV